jgi:hypothetical protein
MPIIPDFMHLPLYEGYIMGKHHKDSFSPISHETHQMSSLILCILIFVNSCKFSFLGVPNILFPSLMTILDTPMFIIQNKNLRPLLCFKHTRLLWKNKMITSSKCYALTMGGGGDTTLLFLKHFVLLKAYYTNFQYHTPLNKIMVLLDAKIKPLSKQRII